MWLMIGSPHVFTNFFHDSNAGRWKILGVPVVIGGVSLPSPVGIGLTDLSNIGGASGSGITDIILWNGMMSDGEEFKNVN